MSKNIFIYSFQKLHNAFINSMYTFFELRLFLSSKGLIKNVLKKIIGEWS